MYKINFIEKLNEQLVFLKNSCKAFDEGQLCEAIRIAVVIRVILHDTKNSISLLKHLNSRSINLLTTVNPNPDLSVPVFHGTGMAQKLKDGSRKLVPSFDYNLTHEFIPADLWWKQLTFKLDGHILLRKDIVLSAANQDGGAHVDKTINMQYAALASDGSGGIHVYFKDGQRIVQLTKDFHLNILRQFGYELLNSLELLNLASKLKTGGITNESTGFFA